MNQKVDVPFDIDTLSHICRQHEVIRLSLFGSMVTGKHTENSDIDILVEFSVPKSLLGLIRLERELSEALGRQVDVLTKPAISPYLEDEILSTLKVIYES